MVIRVFNGGLCIIRCFLPQRFRNILRLLLDVCMKWPQPAFRSKWRTATPFAPFARTQLLFGESGNDRYQQ